MRNTRISTRKGQFNSKEAEAEEEKDYEDEDPSFKSTTEGKR
jgi:hypothetical protein